VATFLQELNRRNVVRTTLAYLAVSWLIVQVADIVLPTFGVASWVMQALIVLFAAGLPVVVILAWVYDLTPEGMERTPDDAASKPLARPAGRKLDFAIIAVLSLALIAMLLDRYVVPVDVARLGPRSLIVLPFSSNQDEEGSLLADGLLGEILTQLYKIEDLTTVGRATAMHYRGTDKPIGEIAEEAGVATVLSGIIIEAEDRARFDVELLEAKSGAMLWGKSYELSNSVRELFRVQSDIATQVAIALEAELSPETRRLLANNPATNDAAYEHYIRGEGFRMRARLQEAVDEYEKATAEDPAFGAAWAALASARAEGSYTGMADTTIAEALAALEQARRLAPDALDTQFAEAAILGVTSEFDRSNEHYHKVLALRPGDIEAMVGLSGNYVVTLRLEEAREFAEQAVSLDPMSFKATWQLAFVHSWSWNFEEARRYYDRVMSFEPESPHAWVFWMRYTVYLLGLGDRVTAKQILDEAPASISTTYSQITYAYLNRDFPKMQELLDATEGDAGIRYEMLALLSRMKGDIEPQREYANSMRISAERRLESMVARGAQPVDIESARSTIALAYALAGNESEAIRVITMAVEQAAADPDRLNAAIVNFNEVMTFVYLGQYDTAVERLRWLLSWATPPYLTPVRLELDPGFDELRGHPDFEELLDELASRTST
jgi:TolB-like protein/Tfp pilus assembly protein PilF